MLNLDESVAVTQNFVSEVTLPHVLAHLRSRSPALVSWHGFDSRRWVSETEAWRAEPGRCAVSTR